MFVKLATQVFSHSVSSAMKTAVAMGQLPAAAEQSATSIGKLNSIFDAMNSKNKFDVNPFKCSVCSSNLQTSENVVRDNIVAAIEWSKSWKMVNIKPNHWVYFLTTFRNFL